MTNVFTAIGTAINFIALIFLALQVRFAVKEAREAAKANAREWSLRFYLETVDRRDTYRLQLPPDRDAAAIQRVIRKALRNRHQDAVVRTYLGWHELLATAVNTGFLDEAVVDKFDGPAIIAVAENYDAWVVHEREIREESTLYRELDELANRLRIRRRAAAEGQ